MIKIDKNGALSKESCQLPDYPLKVYGAKGTQLNNDLVICGGGYPATNECYKFDTSTLSWNQMNSMQEKRVYHGMTSINKSISFPLLFSDLARQEA